MIVERTRALPPAQGDLADRNAMHHNSLQERTLQNQITVRLPADLSAALRRASHQLQRKNSDVVRMALQAFLHVGGRAGRTPAARVRRLVGSLNSGVPDLAERHREYIIEALKHGR
jgi:hypothetical protein